MKFARWTFLIAGIYGLLLILPMLFMEQQMSQNYPPAITHPEYYYGFIAAVTAWQVGFIVMSRDPLRFRPMMLPAMLEKFGYVLLAMPLFMQGRIPGVVFSAVMIDLVIGVLFVVAYLKTRQTNSVERVGTEWERAGQDTTRTAQNGETA
jgi:hypothetical protein